MKKFEYETKYIFMGYNLKKKSYNKNLADEENNILQKQGSLGWELVSIRKNERGRNISEPNDYEIVYYFKREING